MGTHPVTLSQNNVVAVSFQSMTISPYLSILMREASVRKYSPMLKVVDRNEWQGLPSDDGKTEILLPQLELALCVAGESHPILTFQAN